MRRKLKENALEKAEEAKLRSEKMKSDSVKFFNNLAERLELEETSTASDDHNGDKGDEKEFSPAAKSAGDSSTKPRH